MKSLVDNIIELTNYDANCHGLQAKNYAKEIAKHYFSLEDVPFDNWRIREIPLVDDGGKYPVSVVLCVNNKLEQKEITLNLTRNGELFCTNPDELCQINLNSIKDAISHPSSKY